MKHPLTSNLHGNEKNLSPPVYENTEWVEEFPILSAADLNFFLGESFGWPIGLMRESSPKFRRNILAASVAYHLNLNSIDYASRRYVPKDTYGHEQLSLGDRANDMLRESAKQLRKGLRELNTQVTPTFGQFGSQLTLLKVPDLLDSTRMLSNRGLLLESLPLIRLSLEMIAWAVTAFQLDDEIKVRSLKAHACIVNLKPIYESAGRLYGHLSKFSHWEQVIHSEFLSFHNKEVALIRASRHHRATSLVTLVIVLDVLIEAVRKLYPDSSEKLITELQGSAVCDETRRTHQLVTTIVNSCNSVDLRYLQSFLR